MKIELPNYPLMLIEWVDSGRGVSWERFEDGALIDDGARCISVGWLVHENKHRIVLVPHAGWDRERPGKWDQIVGHMSIPVVAVMKRQRIKL